MKRFIGALALATVFGWISTSPGMAAWSGQGSGAAGGAAYVMPAGATPSGSANGGTVTLRWPAAVFPNGNGVAGYTIQRIDAINGAAAPAGTGCAGTVAATTCVETAVPPGTWIYTDTPVQANWTGSASPPSATITTT